MKPQTYKPKHDLWQSVRANWVNGNRSDVLQTIANMPKRDFIAMTYAAIFDSYQLDHESGDLIDLLEILKQF